MAPSPQAINNIVPIRMSPDEERVGADFVEHGIQYFQNPEPVMPSTEVATIDNGKMAIRMRRPLVAPSQARDDAVLQPRASSSTQTEVMPNGHVLLARSLITGRQMERPAPRAAWSGTDAT